MLALTFDTGALIALERGEKRMRTLLLAAIDDGRTVTVPARCWRSDPSNEPTAGGDADAECAYRRRPKGPMRQALVTVRW